MKGLELSRRFYFEAVRPILDQHLPELQHGAALLGDGSEVLGFDDATSTDHHWGPRVQLFVENLEPAEEIDRLLAQELPTMFAGYPTNFGTPDEFGVRQLVATERNPVAHMVEVHTVRGFMTAQLGFDPSEGVTVTDWLGTPSQLLLSVTAGEVFADAGGELGRIQASLAWYPHDVWLYVMAGHWRRVAEYEHLAGRTATRGDDVGSRLLAGALVRDLMRLAFLQQRRYAPYPKWFGSAYALLVRPEQPALEVALTADNWRAREQALVEAYELVAEAHNALEVTEHVDPTVRPFYGRAFRVLDAHRVVAALKAAISDPALTILDHEVGAIDAVSDNTELLSERQLWRSVAGLYDRRAFL